jgi:hypothetical protein
MMKLDEVSQREQETHSQSFKLWHEQETHFSEPRTTARAKVQRETKEERQRGVPRKV